MIEDNSEELARRVVNSRESEEISDSEKQFNNCIEEMRSKNLLAYGTRIDVEFFERHFYPLKRTDAVFSFRISDVRRELVSSGRYLSGIGEKGDAFRIIGAEENARQMQNDLDRSLRLTERAVILGSNTETNTLTDGQKRTLDGKLRSASVRYLMAKNQRGIEKHLKKTAPELIGKSKSEDNPKE